LDPYAARLPGPYAIIAGDLPVDAGSDNEQNAEEVGASMPPR